MTPVPDEKKPDETGFPDIRDRRSEPRLVHATRVSVQVLIPEETFQPRSMTGSSIDLAPGGMSVTVEEMTQDLYLRLLSDRRYIRIAFESPLDSGEVKITGKVVGIDFRKEKAAAPSGPCELRVFFEEGKSDDTGKYMAFISAMSEN